MNSWILGGMDYYPFGMEMPGRSFTAETGYRYGFNGQEKVDEVSGAGNHNTAMFWEYDTRLGRRWNLDPVVKPWQSSYSCFSNSPIWKLDLNGNDDYYNFAGKFVGSDNQGSGIRLVSSKAAFDAMQKKGIETLRGNTRVIKVQDNEADVVSNLYDKSVSDKVERKVYFILDTKNATLSVEEQPIDPEDTKNSSINKYKTYSRGGDKYKSPDGDDGNKVIVGQAHGHPGLADPGKVSIPGTSPGDKQAASDLGTPVYAVDKESIWEVDQSGQTTDGQCKDECSPILIDALETSGGKPK